MSQYRGGLLTTVFSHVISLIEKEYLHKIFYIQGGRWFNDEKTKSKSLLPYLSLHIRTTKSLSLRKNSETMIPDTEWKDIIKTVRGEGFGDLTVSGIALRVQNMGLKENIENSLGRNISNTEFVVLFTGNLQSAKEDKIDRMVANIMQDSVKKYGLKYATLELSGIYTLQDWRTQKNVNLLTTSKINLDKEIIKDMIISIFKPTIKIGGADIKARFIKWYDTTNKKVLKLSGCETV